MKVKQHTLPAALIELVQWLVAQETRANAAAAASSRPK
jgi:hypothetical protein